MKIVALIGSLRQKSFNRAAFETYREINAAEADFVEGVFRDFPLYDDDVKDRGFPESVMRLNEQIARADAVMFFSPEYNYSVPGALKNGLDWISRIKGHALAGKPAAIVGATPGRLGTSRMQYHLRQIGVFLDLRFMNLPEVMISNVASMIGNDGKLNDAATREFLRAHFAAFKTHVAAHAKKA